MEYVLGTLLIVAVIGLPIVVLFVRDRRHPKPRRRNDATNVSSSFNDINNLDL